MQAVSVSALYNSEIKTKVFPGMQHQTKHTCAYYRNTEVPYNPVMFSSTSKFLSPVIQLGERLFCTPRSFSGSLRQICPDIRHSLVQEGHLIVWTVVRNFPPVWEKQVLRAIEDPRWSPKICPFFLQSFTWNEIEKHNHLGVCFAKCVSAVGLLYFSFCRKLLVIGCILV